MRKEWLPDFLHLYHGFGSNNGELRRLLEYFDHDPQRLRHAEASELRAIGATQPTRGRLAACHARAVERDLQWAEDADHNLICYDDARYPALLREIPDFPLLLYACGDASLLRQPQIAIVGSRNCTPGGARSAQEFAASLAAAGLVITSGLALGIDSAAHRGALDAGGRTLAVLGSGIDVIYPQRNRGLAQKINAQGLLLSEFALGSQALPACFPQRNRIISGLALATVVVEAAQRSGSLITARLAAEQGREVFALPGSINNPQARGCHRLIRDGAQLAESPQQITHDLGGLFDFVFANTDDNPPAPARGLHAEHLELLEAIGYDPVNCDILVQRSGLTIDRVSSMLVELELKDLIQSAPGGCFVRI